MRDKLHLSFEDSIFQMDGGVARLSRGPCLASLLPQLSVLHLKAVLIRLFLCPLELFPDVRGGLEVLLLRIPDHAVGGYIFSVLIDGGQHAGAVELVGVRPLPVAGDPDVLELSLHRVGRTCRTGLDGDSSARCLKSPDRSSLRGVLSSSMLALCAAGLAFRQSLRPASSVSASMLVEACLCRKRLGNLSG